MPPTGTPGLAPPFHSPRDGRLHVRSPRLSWLTCIREPGSPAWLIGTSLAHRRAREFALGLVRSECVKFLIRPVTWTMWALSVFPDGAI